MTQAEQGGLYSGFSREEMLCTAVTELAVQEALHGMDIAKDFFLPPRHVDGYVVLQRWTGIDVKNDTKAKMLVDEIVADIRAGYNGK